MRLTLIVIALAAFVTGATPAFPQQSCTHVSEGSVFPPRDNVPLAGSNTCARDYMNRLRNLTGEIQDHLLQLIETPCTTITVAPGARSLFALTTQATLTGTEMISPSIDDSSDPPMFDAPQVGSASGTTINLWVFNHSETIRQGKLCAAVMRP